MMVNANLMLLVILLWAGTLPVASPKHHSYMPKTFWDTEYCDKYILPLNTMWIPRTSCGDNKRYSCQAGYNSQVQTTCKHGDWILEPICQAVHKCPRGKNITDSKDLTESRLFNEEFIFKCSINGTPEYNWTGTLTCGENSVWKTKLACPGAVFSTTVEYAASNPNITCAEACANDTNCSFYEDEGYCNLFAKPVIFHTQDYSFTLSGCLQLCQNDTRCLSVSYLDGFKQCDLYNINASTFVDVYKPRSNYLGHLVDRSRLLP